MQIFEELIMSVVAWDGKMLAADTLMTDNSGRIQRASKIFRISENVIAGVSGRLTAGMELIAWLEEINMDYKNHKSSFPKICLDEDFDVLVIEKLPHHWGTRILNFENCPTPIKIGADFEAIGSGSKYAVAAMYHGKTAIEAVETACFFDTNCSCQRGAAQVLAF